MFDQWLSRLTRRRPVSPVRSPRRRLAVEELENRALPSTLPYGVVISDTVSAPATSVEYTFSANTGAIFSLAMTSTPLEANFDAFADVFAPSGDAVDHFFATGQRYYVAGQTGTYTVRVHDHDLSETGMFTLGLEGQKPISPDPVALVPGGIIGGTIDGPIDVKQFTFTGMQGDLISLAMTSTPGEAGFDAFADVFAPSGSAIDHFFATGQRYLTLPEDGTYMVQMHDHDFSEAGSYTIGLEGQNPISPNPGTLVPGGIVGGAINGMIDVKQFTFTGQQGQTITLAMTSTSNEAEFAAFADVFAPSGDAIDHFFATGQRYLTLPESGTYMVQMHDHDYTQGGSFTIGLEGIHPISPSPTPLVPGGFVEGGVDTGIDVKQFTFEATAGNILGLSLTSTPGAPGFDAFADVFAPSGTALDHFFATGLRYLTVQETGTFMVQLHDHDYSQMGTFKIGLEGVKPPSPNALQLQGGMTATGMIASTNDVVQFLFMAGPGDALQISLTSTPDAAGFDAFADVIAPSGTALDHFFAVNQRPMNLSQSAETGLYLIQIHDHDFTQAGHFTLRIDGIAPAPASIGGTVFHDVNLDGTRQGTEAGLADRVMFLDANGNGMLDVNDERSTTTDVQGNYSFPSLLPGTHIVREVLPAGWRGTNPSSGVRSVTVAAGQNSTSNHFGNTQSPLGTALISGRVFNDANGNGVRNVGETWLGLWTVYIDANKNGRRDANERSTVTDVNGNWSFTGLAAGKYAVRIVQIAGTKITTPGGAIFNVTLKTGQKVTNRLFGVRSTR